MTGNLRRRASASASCPSAPRSCGLAISFVLRVALEEADDRGRHRQVEVGRADAARDRVQVERRRRLTARSAASTCRSSSVVVRRRRCRRVAGAVVVVVPLGRDLGREHRRRARTPTGSGRTASRASGSTSRISTSMTISARGLSFCAMIRSMICTTDAGAADGDRVGRLVDLRSTGWIGDAGQPDDRAEHLRQLGRVGVRDVERLDRPARRTARASAACPGRRRSSARSGPCTTAGSSS